MNRSRTIFRPRLALVVLCCVLFPLPSHAQDRKPNSSDRDRGIELYRQQRTSEAIAALRRVVAADKKDQEAWYYLGLAQIQADDFKAASKSLETALALQPAFASAHAALAYALLQRNKIEEAAREAQRAIALDATNADAHYILGMTRMGAGANAEAVELADKAIKLRPDFAAAYLLKAQGLLALIAGPPPGKADGAMLAPKGRQSQAAEALEKYLQLAPNAPRKEFWRAQLEALKRPQPTVGQIFRSSEVSTRARILNKPEPSYTDEARYYGVKGTVVLRAVFAADGTVRNIVVLRGLPHGLSEVCVEAARKIKFVPATLNGQPVSTWMQLEYNFMIG